jgi:alcohol dehydrogenase (cytochrome c)
MRPRRDYVILALVVAAAGAVGLGLGLYHARPVQVSLTAAAGRDQLLSLNAPPGTVTTEKNTAYQGTGAAAPPAAAAPGAATGDWASYNKTLTSERYSNLSQINTQNVGKLKVQCTYDVQEFSSFETGLLMVQGALIGTSEFDIFSLDPATCKENWRTHESIAPSLLPANRGAAYMDGRLFRGTQDGRVQAFDFNTGKRVWETTIADVKKGETVPAAPIAWDGLVLIGNAGGDFKGGKGRMYALDAKTGKVVWEFYLVPKTEGDPVLGPQGASPLNTDTWKKNLPDIPITGGGAWSSYSLDPDSGLLYIPTGNPGPDFSIAAREGENLFTDSIVVLDARTGAYKSHVKLVPRDWHDWDASNPPALVKTAGGKQVMLVAPKDGHLYAFDRADNHQLYRVPVTTIENVEEPFSPDKDVHFCPGAGGGEEWNSPAYDPQSNLVFVGDVDWCVTVRVKTNEELQKVAVGQPWFGERSLNPFFIGGMTDRSDGHWAGWIHAVDADTGVWKWRVKSNYPIIAAVTPTAGGLVFFGDVGGNLYALNAETGEKLWGQQLEAALAGGIITYAVNGQQKVAVASGLVSAAWPVPVRRSQVTILGLEGDGAQ